MRRYIDAEKLKSFLRPEEWGTPDERWVPEHEIGALLDLFPAADVAEVRHGRWADNVWVWTCSECGNDASADWDYCPHCGAKMDIKRER